MALQGLCPIGFSLISKRNIQGEFLVSENWLAPTKNQENGEANLESCDQGEVCSTPSIYCDHNYRIHTTTASVGKKVSTQLLASC